MDFICTCIDQCTRVIDANDWATKQAKINSGFCHANTDNTNTVYHARRVMKW